LTSSKMFPSRLGLGGAGGGAGVGTDKVLQLQMKEITNIFRRVYRIYAHAWFQHREMFWRVEGKTGLYVFFKTVCDEYGLIQPENYTIPPEAEGAEPSEGKKGLVEGVPTIQLLKREEGKAVEEAEKPEPAGNTILAAGDTTKRHRHTLSDRSNSVSTVIQEETEEEDEEDAEPQTAVQETQTATGIEAAAERTPAQPTDEKSSAQAVPEDGAEKADDETDIGEEQDPALGIVRSETIKPQAPKDEEQEVDTHENESEGETTVVEPAAATETKQEGEEDGTDKAEANAMEPSEASAADGAEAGKTVAD